MWLCALRGNGNERARGFQAAHRQRVASSCGLDSGRRGVLHHGSPLLLVQQAPIYALRVPLLRTRRLGMPHRGRVGHTVEDVEERRLRNPLRRKRLL